MPIKNPMPSAAPKIPANERLRASEQGFTLIELIVAIAIFTIVGFGGVSLLLSSTRDQARISDRARDVANTRIALERIVREIRVGTAIVGTPTATSLVFNAYLHTNCAGTAATTTATLCRVSYSCTAGTCTRTTSATDGSGASTARRVITGVNNTPIFTSAGSPVNHVDVTFRVPTQDTRGSVTLTDGATLRGATLTY